MGVPDIVTFRVVLPAAVASAVADSPLGMFVNQLVTSPLEALNVALVKVNVKDPVKGVPTVPFTVPVMETDADGMFTITEHVAVCPALVATTLAVPFPSAVRVTVLPDVPLSDTTEASDVVQVIAGTSASSGVTVAVAVTEVVAPFVSAVQDDLSSVRPETVPI